MAIEIIILILQLISIISLGYALINTIIYINRLKREDDKDYSLIKHQLDLMNNSLETINKNTEINKDELIKDLEWFRDKGMKIIVLPNGDRILGFICDDRHEEEVKFYLKKFQDVLSGKLNNEEFPKQEIKKIIEEEWQNV